MRRRGASDGAAPPPEYLMNLAVWMAEGHSPHPGPAPEWWDHGESYAVFEARRDWSRARQRWFREHDNGTLEMVNTLYREGFNDLAPDPRRGDSELLRGRSQPVEAIALVKRALRSGRGRSSHVKGAYGVASDGAAHHP